MCSSDLFSASPEPSCASSGSSTPAAISLACTTCRRTLERGLLPGSARPDCRHCGPQSSRSSLGSRSTQFAARHRLGHAERVPAQHVDVLVDQRQQARHVLGAVGAPSPHAGPQPSGLTRSSLVSQRQIGGGISPALGEMPQPHEFPKTPNAQKAHSNHGFAATLRYRWARAQIVRFTHRSGVKGQRC